MKPPDSVLLRQWVESPRKDSHLLRGKSTEATLELSPIERATMCGVSFPVEGTSGQRRAPDSGEPSAIQELV